MKVNKNSTLFSQHKRKWTKTQINSVNSNKRCRLYLLTLLLRGCTNLTGTVSDKFITEHWHNDNIPSKVKIFQSTYWHTDLEQTAHRETQKRKSASYPWTKQKYCIVNFFKANNWWKSNNLNIHHQSSKHC